MQKIEPKVVLRGLSWVYILFVVSAVVLAVFFGFAPNVPDSFASLAPKGSEMDLRLFIINLLIVGAILNIWYLWLLKRFVDGKSNGGFYILLLIFGAAFNLVSVIKFGSLAYLLNAILDMIIISIMLMAKKEV